MTIIKSILYGVLTIFLFSALTAVGQVQDTLEVSNNKKGKKKEVVIGNKVVVIFSQSENVATFKGVKKYSRKNDSLYIFTAKLLEIDNKELLFSKKKWNHDTLRIALKDLNSIHKTTTISKIGLMIGTQAPIAIVASQFALPVIVFVGLNLTSAIFIGPFQRRFLSRKFLYKKMDLNLTDSDYTISIVNQQN